MSLTYHWVASQIEDLSCRTLKSISVFESRPCFPWAAPRQWLGLGRTLKPTCSWETWNSFIGQLWGQGFSTGSLGCPHLTSPLSFLRVRLTSLSDGYLSLPPISSLFPSCMPPSLYPLIQEFPFMRFFMRCVILFRCLLFGRSSLVNTINSVVLKLHRVLESPGGFVKTQMAGPPT